MKLSVFTGSKTFSRIVLEYVSKPVHAESFIRDLQYNQLEYKVNE
jgi:hypothetical protein